MKAACYSTHEINKMCVLLFADKVCLTTYLPHHLLLKLSWLTTTPFDCPFLTSNHGSSPQSGPHIDTWSVIWNEMRFGSDGMCMGWQELEQLLMVNLSATNYYILIDAPGFVQSIIIYWQAILTVWLVVVVDRDPTNASSP